MASRPARASTRERVDLRRVVHVSRVVADRAEAWWVTGLGYLRHASRGTRQYVLIWVDGLVRRFWVGWSAQCGHR